MTQSEFSKILLDERGREFVLNYLSHMRGLSAKLKRRVEQQGSCFAYLPSSLPPDMAYNFNWGGIQFLSGESGRDSFVEHCLALNSSHKDGILFFHDPYIRPADTRFFPFSKFQLHSSDCVYFFVPHYAMTEENCNEMLSEIVCFDCVGVYAEISDAELQFLISRNAVDELEDKIASTAIEVFVRAYDAEGFVFCHL